MVARNCPGFALSDVNPAQRFQFPGLVAPWRLWVPAVAVLGFLWLTLVNQLRVEWAVNPQYAYGWAVPVLCLYLLWQRTQGGEQKTEDRRQKTEDRGQSTEDGRRRTDGGRQKTEVQAHSTEGRGQRTEDGGRTAAASAREGAGKPRSFVLGPLLLLALLWLPTRLIQEANPEWRLVSWALALEVVGMTLALVWLAFGAARLAQFAFPIAYFLVAVPWPTLVEGPLVQTLSRANAAGAVEVSDWLGVPAIQHGNTIEVSTGVVGIDDACSGIRSLQATLMVSLFLGELYRLSRLRRAALCVAGFTLAFLFNLGRTSLLVWVAARKGIPAIAQWHDPAGVSILVACLVGLWLVALWLRRRPAARDSATAAASSAPPSPPVVLRVPTGSRLPTIRPWLYALGAWLVLAEAGVEAWYRYHEARLPAPTVWTVEWPRSAPEFAVRPFAEKTRQFLRFDEGLSASWSDPAGARWQGIFLRWNPGRIAVHLAKSHTPEACLPAAGRQLVSTSEVKEFLVHGLRLPFRSYLVDEAGHHLHVFYCLWEDRAPDRHFAATGLSYGNRLAPMLAGRRQLGQRSIELAVWGIEDAADAETAVKAQLEKLLRVQPGNASLP